MAEKWTKTSFPPSRSIKPKPLSPLNHLTVPVIRSDIVFASFGNLKNIKVFCLVPSEGKTKATHVSNRELLVFVLPTRTYCYPTALRITHYQGKVNQYTLAISKAA